MFKKIVLIGSTIFTAVILIGCSVLAPTPTPIQTSQYLETNLAQLILPLSDEAKKTQIVRLSTGQLNGKKDNNIIIEQHAFKGGRITSVSFEFLESPKNIIPRIKDSAYVKSYLGQDRILGEIKKLQQTSITDISLLNIQGYGDIRYAMATNPQKTKICAIFSMSISYQQGSEAVTWVLLFASPFPQKYRTYSIDGVLCDSARNKNIYVMEAYAKRFISSINIQKY